ncbi:MAG: hypothetical protein AAGA56_03030 [Myxococcota bacterium]
MKAKGYREVTPMDVLLKNVEKAKSGDGCDVPRTWFAKADASAVVTVGVSYCVDRGWTSIDIHDCNGSAKETGMCKQAKSRLSKK